MLPNTPPLTLWMEYNTKLLDLCQTEQVLLLSFDWDQATYQAALEIVNAEFGLHVKTDGPSFYESRLINSSDKDAPDDVACVDDLQGEAICLYRDLQALAIKVHPYSQSEVLAAINSVPDP